MQINFANIKALNLNNNDINDENIDNLFQMQWPSLNQLNIGNFSCLFYLAYNFMT